MGAIKSKVFGETQDEEIKNYQTDTEIVSINCKEPTNLSFTSGLSNSSETSTYIIVPNDKNDNLIQITRFSNRSNTKESSHNFPLLDFSKLESKHHQKIRPYTLFDQSNPKKKKENSNKEINKMDASGPSVTSFQPPNHLQKSQYFRSFRMASRRIFNQNIKKNNEKINENKALFKSSDDISTSNQDSTKKQIAIVNNSTNNNSSATNAFSKNNANTNALSNLNSCNKILTNIVNLDKNLETDLIIKNDTSTIIEAADIRHKEITQQAFQNTTNLKSKSTIDFTNSGFINPYSCLQTSATSTKLTLTNSQSVQSHNYSKTSTIQNKSFRNHNFNSSNYFSSIRRRFTCNSNQINNKISSNSSNIENLNTNTNTDIVNNEKIKIQENESEMLSAIDPRKFRSTSIVETFSDKINSIMGVGSSSSGFIRSESNIPFLSFSNMSKSNNNNINTNLNNTITPSPSQPHNILSSVINHTSSTKMNANTDTINNNTKNNADNEAPRNSETVSSYTNSIDSSIVNTDINTNDIYQNTNNTRSTSVNEISKSNLKNINRESVTSSSTDWDSLTENQNKNENLINDLKKQIDSLNKQLEHLGREDSKIINELSDKIENLAKMNVNIITAIGTQQENKFRASFFGRTRQPSQTSEVYYARLKQQNEMLLLQQRQIEQLRKDLLGSFVSSQNQASTSQPNISQNATFAYPDTSYYNNQNYNGYSRPTMSSTYTSYPTSPYSSPNYYFTSTPNQATPTTIPSTSTMTSPTFSGSGPFVATGYSGNGQFYMNRNGSYPAESNQYFYYPTTSQSFQRTTLNNINSNGVFYDPGSGQYFQYQRGANLSQAQYLYNQNLNGIYANIYAYRRSQAQSQQSMNDTNNVNSSFENINRDSEQFNVIITEVLSDDEELNTNSKLNSKKDYVDAISLNEEEN